jgi:hypothetical protein
VNEKKKKFYPQIQGVTQVYYNTLHEEVHVLYTRLHPDVPADPVAMGVGPSGTAGEGTNGELDLFRPPPSMNLADDRSPMAGNEDPRPTKTILV